MGSGAVIWSVFRRRPRVREEEGRLPGGARPWFWRAGVREPSLGEKSDGGKERRGRIRARFRG